MSITKIARTQGTFSVYAEKINELIDAQKPLTAGENIEIKVSDENILISSTGGSGGGDGTPEEFTICDSGTPATRWWRTFLTNPDA